MKIRADIEEHFAKDCSILFVPMPCCSLTKNHVSLPVQYWTLINLPFLYIRCGMNLWDPSNNSMAFTSVLGSNVSSRSIVCQVGRGPYSLLYLGLKAAAVTDSSSPMVVAFNFQLLFENSRFFVAVHNSSTLFMMAVDAMISIRRSESAVDRNVRDDDESK